MNQAVQLTQQYIQTLAQQQWCPSLRHHMNSITIRYWNTWNKQMLHELWPYKSHTVCVNIIDIPCVDVIEVTETFNNYYAKHDHELLYMLATDPNPTPNMPRPPYDLLLCQHTPTLQLERAKLNT